MILINANEHNKMFKYPWAIPILKNNTLLINNCLVHKDLPVYGDEMGT